MKYIGETKIEKILFKYLIYILVISFFASLILTWIKWPEAPPYYPWEAFLTDRRLLLVAGKYQGHSYAMWLMAFCVALIIKNTSEKKRFIKALLGVCLIIFLSWALVETESRTALLFIVFLLIGWAAYFKIIPRQVFAFMPIMIIAAFYLGIVMTAFQPILNKTVNNLQETFPAFRITLPEIYNDRSAIYNGRDVLNNALLSSAATHPWFGSGSSTPILIYGVDRYGNIAYFDNKVYATESTLRVLVKFGAFYLGSIIIFLLTPIWRAIRGYYKDNIFVISVCGIIVISSINGSVLENLYSISGLFAVILILYNVIPKYVKGNRPMNIQTSHSMKYQ